MNGMFYRGEVYYVLPDGNEVGSEQHSGRPAIIVSNNQNNKNAATVEIVYLTTREKRAMLTHVYISTAQLPSTAICEQIFTVDKTRLGSYSGKLTEREMKDVELAMMVSLGLDNYLSKPKPVEAPTVAAVPVPAPVAVPSVSDIRGDLEKLRVQRDTYKELLMEVIGRK
jgi:mRNA interferase MazF